MIKMSVVLKSGQIIEAVTIDEHSYKEYCSDLLNGKTSFVVIETEGFYPAFINPKEVAGITAETFTEDDDPEDDDEDSNIDVEST